MLKRRLFETVLALLYFKIQPKMLIFTQFLHVFTGNMQGHCKLQGFYELISEKKCWGRDYNAGTLQWLWPGPGCGACREPRRTLQTLEM